MTFVILWWSLSQSGFCLSPSNFNRPVFWQNLKHADTQYLFLMHRPGAPLFVPRCWHVPFESRRSSWQRNSVKDRVHTLMIQGRNRNIVSDEQETYVVRAMCMLHANASWDGGRTLKLLKHGPTTQYPPIDGARLLSLDIVERCSPQRNQSPIHQVLDVWIRKLIRDQSDECEMEAANIESEAEVDKLK